ncbi:uncharacterized protein EI90DRAFT_2706658 [Cantharellus anzutake]|uniref:uncharacterized protein n=1 Tax=Cantharellus anzutake TaxID=1750568 RepID=UPI0019068BD3|nr:uncharacterized protein EI90DRAFT_2706658 [Cantharellus anzutake]KAF8318565.1 hypothetical protein EI90DRAFT_2706658 [Cantharellus anzutake]
MTAPANSPSPVTASSTQGALPTPQTTPSMVHAARKYLKPASSRPLFEEHVKGSFSSPTPPNSEIDDNPNECSRPPSAKPKLKFDFISPFDAFGSTKDANELPAQPAAPPTPGTVGTKPLMSPTLTSTASTSQHSPSALRSNDSSTLEHFAPPSVEARRISNARKALASLVTNSVSSGAKSTTNASPDPHSNRQAQRIALLQSLSTQLLPKSSSPHPSASSQPRIEDSPFVVNPARAPTISPSQLFTPRAPQLHPSPLHMGATLPRHITSFPIYPILAQPREPAIPLQPSLDPVPNNYRMISGTKPLMPFPIPGIPPPNSHGNVAPRNDILNLLNGPQVRSTPFKLSPFTIPPFTYLQQSM